MSCELILGNCVEELKKIPSDSIDLTVTSPPYDKIRDYEDNAYLNIKDTECIIEELYRVTKMGGTVVWIIGDSVVDGDESGTSFYHALSFKQHGFKLKDTMIYIKNGGINAGALNAYQQKFEYMFVFTKGKQKTHNLIRDRKNKYVETRKKLKRQKDGSFKEQEFKTEEYGVRYNYWVYDTGKNKSTKDKIAFEHPAIFPEELAKDHIISWSNIGDVVLDPFMGSGTTGKMALINGRNFVGIEISEKYYHIAEERISRIISEKEKEND